MLGVEKGFMGSFFTGIPAESYRWPSSVQRGSKKRNTAPPGVRIVDAKSGFYAVLEPEKHHEKRE